LGACTCDLSVYIEKTSTAPKRLDNIALRFVFVKPSQPTGCGFDAWAFSKAQFTSLNIQIVFVNLCLLNGWQ
jgi:hypothetical protein